MAESRRDEFPNNFVGDLVPTERGWVVVPPTCCLDGHNYSDGGWSVSSVWRTCVWVSLSPRHRDVAAGNRLASLTRPQNP